MKIAIAQINTVAGDFESTLQIMTTYGQRAQERGAELVVYPSPVLMGPDPMALIDNKNYVASALDTLNKLAQNLEVDALVPLVMGTAGAVFTSYAYLHGGEVMCAGMLDRLGPLSAGAAEIGVAFTPDDLEAFASGMIDADVVCYIPVLGFNADDKVSLLACGVSQGAFVEAASEMGSWIVAVNAAGAYEDYVYTGSSFVMSPAGELAYMAPSMGEALLLADVDIDAENVGGEALTPPSYEREHLLWDAAALALRDQVAKRGFEGATLLLDGTFATSAVAVVATDALGPMKVSALIAAQGPALADAHALAASLHLHVVDEVNPHDIEALGGALDGDADAQTLAHKLLYLRLASQAAHDNLLVLSEADKTQLALEDPEQSCCVGAFAPFGDVFRSDVLAAARWRSSVSPVFSDSVFARLALPTGLSCEALPDDAELAINTLDAALVFYLERSASLQELASLGQGEEFARMLVERLHAARAARRFAPNFPVLSNRSLDEAAAPLTDRWIDAGSVSPKLLAALQHSPFSQGMHNISGANLADAMQQAFGESLEEGGTELPQQLAQALSFLQELTQSSQLTQAIRHKSDGEGSAWVQEFFSDN